MLEVRNLSVSYGQHRALDKVSIRVNAGEIVVILGANGAGKSSLLKAISGISEGRVTGEILMDGTDMLQTPAARIVEAGIALVPEGRGVFGDLTVQENLTLGAYSARARDDEAANLDRVFGLFPKLVERRRQMVRSMSGGEQQMVAIGRAMMSNPQLLTLDEPSLGLSPLLCKELFQNLKLVRDLGIGVLLVEQNARQSLAIADRGYLLENAHIVHEGSAEKLRTDPAVQAAYLGAASAAKGPRTDPEPSGAVSDIAVAAMQSFQVRARSLQTRSADAVLGRSVGDLVRSATARQAEEMQDRRRPVAMAAKPDLAAHGDRLRATLDAIEAAAAKARRPSRIERRDIPRQTPMKGSDDA